MAIIKQKPPQSDKKKTHMPGAKNKNSTPPKRGRRKSPGPAWSRALSLSPLGDRAIIYYAMGGFLILACFFLPMNPSGAWLPPHDMCTPRQAPLCATHNRFNLTWPLHPQLSVENRETGFLANDSTSTRSIDRLVRGYAFPRTRMTAIGQVSDPD